MNKQKWMSLRPRITRVAWALLFITLPVTSFPFFPSGLGGKTLVRPLAIYPLALILLLVIIPRLFKRPLPRTFLPLLAFTVIALISSVAAFSFDLEAFRGVTVASRFVRNIATLAIGMAFYVTVSLLPQSWDDLRFSLRWLYAGFAAALAWGSLQILYVIHYSPAYYKLLSQIQNLVSTRKLFTTRISGPAYEPKWFAEQICFLLLPWLLSSVLSGRTIFAWRYKWITVEWILIAWSAVALVFTYSRTGLFILVLLTFLCYLMVRSNRFRSMAQNRPVAATIAKKSRSRRVAEAMVITGGLVTVILLVGSQNPYFSRLWRYYTEAKRRDRTYLEYIAFQQRFVYWVTAFRTFEAHPMLGVGLGNYAFFFDEMLPDQQYDRQVEIMRQITPGEGRDRLITPKNLVARLLAETGIFGIASFSTFILAILGCTLYMWFSPSREQRYWGLSGMLGLIVFSIVVLSFDSFALPNMWIVFGLITAATHLSDPAALPAVVAPEKLQIE
jgi:hypothetical protein